MNDCNFCLLLLNSDLSAVGRDLGLAQALVWGWSGGANYEFDFLVL